uniref:protein-serine/threonine phosphatase n=1 Tax=Leptocylindrus danicus TaxID=163516 RepID=A0A7S2PS74_9STRA|mmetsp:Transcript_9152/g.13686  ORF Transcript_9152/g.13686 Transcript_9152/m.13686 type:complete len:340 (+) Transcript_9152:267-1286(+)
MGSMLDKPITEKETEKGEANSVVYGVSGMQGWRVEMEDSHTLVGSIPALPTMGFFGCYDGHGGSYTSAYAGDHLMNIFSERPEFKQYLALTQAARDSSEGIDLIKAALNNAFLQIDEKMLAESEEDRDPRDRSGCTCIVVVVTEKHLICSNAGDSRACYSRDGHAVPLSFDHKPNDAEEHSRIDRAGGYVSMRRVDGDLAVSRALGDFQYKDRADLPAEEQKVTAKPDLIVYPRDPEKDEFMVVACDGIWDVVSNDECVNMVQKILDEGETDMGLVCEEVLDSCLELNSRDNMTALIVAFPSAKFGKGGGVAARRDARKALLEEQMKAESGAAEGENSA